MKQVQETRKQTMEEYKDDENDDILSLSDLQMDEHGSEEVNTTFYQDFFGEEWSRNNKSSPVKQPVCDDNVKKQARKRKETNPMFRSKSGSFRYMRFKIDSGRSSWRSSSVSVMASKSMSRWQVFMSGFGSGKFPTKMDWLDIKTRQLRSRSTTKESQNVDHVGGEDSGGRRVIDRKKVWWRLVDVLGCGGGYERNTMVVV
ncbi:hypothetical protein L1987_36034 [Smallanthus sonchifolius]|uniref:Uncharacterized protein n=1 Tax=Smallanthus sonchifolius TaxID=185202 RepID=A0ACB9HE34_9ASTR|nr:hypothetical protein L1987_36034 [Smallanthus sonchifolius]